MIAFVAPEPGIDALARALEGAAAEGAKGAMVLGCAANGWSHDEVGRVLRASPLVCFGGLFPALVHDGCVLRQGVGVIGFREAPKTAWISGETDLALEPRASSGLFAFADAAAPLDDLLERLYAAVGPDVACLGGGCGDLAATLPAPVITPEGLRGGGLLVADIGRPLAVAKAHGWSPTGAELCVTRAHGEVLEELNWQPAREVYREALAALGVPAFGDDDFSRVAGRFPLLLQEVTEDTLVRDLLGALPGGALRCAGSVYPHTMLRVGHSDAPQMLAAAYATSDALRPRFDPAGDALLTLCCVSRDLLLRERLALELDALRLVGALQLGALTIGEVVGDGASMMRLHNKCVALGAWRQGP